MKTDKQLLETYGSIKRVGHRSWYIEDSNGFSAGGYTYTDDEKNAIAIILSELRGLVELEVMDIEMGE